MARWGWSAGRMLEAGAGQRQCPPGLMVFPSTVTLLLISSRIACSQYSHHQRIVLLRLPPLTCRQPGSASCLLERPAQHMM